MRQITYKEVLDIHSSEVLVSTKYDEYKKALDLELGVRLLKPWQKMVVQQVTRLALLLTPGVTLWAGKLVPVNIVNGRMETTASTLWYEGEDNYFYPMDYVDVWDILDEDWSIKLYEVV